MTTADKAKAIITLLQREEKFARGALIEAKVSLAGQQARAECWKREQEDNDPCSSLMNRFDTSHEKRQLEQAEERFAKAKEVLDFALDHFLSMIPDESEEQKALDQFLSTIPTEGKRVPGESESATRV